MGLDNTEQNTLFHVWRDIEGKEKNREKRIQEARKNPWGKRKLNIPRLARHGTEQKLKSIDLVFHFVSYM